MKKYKLYINGQLVPSSKGCFFDSLNPSTGDALAQVADAGIDDMTAAIQAARQAFDAGSWTGMSVPERGIYLRKIAQVIRGNAAELAELESLDTGKTSKQTTFIDVPTCADTFDYFGSIEDDIFSRDVFIKAPVKSRVVREPLGVVGQIVPWNYPLIFFGWKVAPALIAGNTVVFRPSSQSGVSTARLAELIADIGLPAGVLNIVTSSAHEVAACLTESPLVDKISFTGGTETGKNLARQSAGTLKRLTLELGGKSPNIVFADSDFDAALGGTLAAIFMNQGQMCTAGSRLFLEEKIYDAFVAALVKKTKSLKIGDALDRTTDFGPLISERQRQTILDFIAKGRAEGARLLCGGKIPEGEAYQKGFYLEPAIFTDVTKEMTLAREEIFGPVLSVMKFSSEEEAVALANDSPYGLAACVWTKDKDKAARVAGQLKCGTVWINTYGGFYNEAPFGGCKQSGYGSDLGLEGLFEYTHAKHICADATPGGQPLVAHWF